MASVEAGQRADQCRLFAGRRGCFRAVAAPARNGSSSARADRRDGAGRRWQFYLPHRRDAWRMPVHVVPIAAFIYGYFLLALRRFFGLGALASSAITLLFAAGSTLAEDTFHGLHGSVGYLPALGEMICFAALLWSRTRRCQTADGLALAAADFRGVADLSDDGRRGLRWLFRSERILCGIF